MKSATQKIFFLVTCSHRRAVDLYLDSIKNQEKENYFESLLCDSWEQFTQKKCQANQKVTMGENLSR